MKLMKTCDVLRDLVSFVQFKAVQMVTNRAMHHI